jgi:hypothetical protein
VIYNPYPCFWFQCYSTPDTLQRPELWGAIQTTPYLQAMLEPMLEGNPGLLRVPLFVKLVVDVYDPQQPISSKADLLDKYIDRQLSFDKRDIDRCKELDEYKWAYKTAQLEPDWKKTRSHLKWIACNLQADNKTEFLIEHMQPGLIDSVRSQYYYRLIFGSIFGLLLGLFNMLSSIAFNYIYNHAESRNVLSYAGEWIATGLLIGLISNIHKNKGSSLLGMLN